MPDLDQMAREIAEGWLGIGHHDSAALASDILAALRRVEAETREEWRPIDTAPKDGTPVLLYFPSRYQGKGGISWGCWINNEWLDSVAIRDNSATHWMPLPPPPSKEGDA